MNKKDLIKKVNQLTNSQNGGSGAGDWRDIPPNLLRAQRGRPPVQPNNVHLPAQELLRAQRGRPPVRPTNLHLPGPALLQFQDHHPQPVPALPQAQHYTQQQPGPELLQAQRYTQQQPVPALLQFQGHHLQPGPALPQAQRYPPPPPLTAQRYPPPPQPNAPRNPPPPPPPPNAQRNPPPPQSRPHNAAQNRIRCPSPGWAQQQNDCWIDSAYYAMFVPSNLQNWFLPFITTIGEFGINTLKKFSDLSIEYLKGIDGNKEFIQRKKEIKKNILVSIREVLTELSRNNSNISVILGESRHNPQAIQILATYNTRGQINNYDNTGLMNKSGNGDAFIFFQFISLLNKQLRFFQSPSWTEVFAVLNQSNRSKPIKNYIIQRLNQRDNQGIDIVVIDASYLISISQEAITPEIRLCMNDNTVLQEILNINGFSLEAVIRGNRYHFTVDFKCLDNQWYNYNNQGGSRRISQINVETRNWQGQDGLIFIFRRRS